MKKVPKCSTVRWRRHCALGFTRFELKARQMRVQKVPMCSVIFHWMIRSRIWSVGIKLSRNFKRLQLNIGPIMDYMYFSSLITRFIALKSIYFRLFVGNRIIAPINFIFAIILSWIYLIIKQNSTFPLKWWNQAKKITIFSEQKDEGLSKVYRRYFEGCWKVLKIPFEMIF
jgi:hypothetical protein